VFNILNVEISRIVEKQTPVRRILILKKNVENFRN